VPHAAKISNAAVAAAFVGVVIALADTARAQVPTINVETVCREAAAVTLSLVPGGANDVEICLNSEDNARQQMIKNWSNFDRSDRSGCIQPNVYLPSYVEWLTCFEMNKVVREAKTQGVEIQDVLKESRGGYITLPTLGKNRGKINYAD
jgi:hypothetical protein